MEVTPPALTLGRMTPHAPHAPYADPAAGAAVKAADRAHVFHSWSAQGLIDPLAVAGAEGSYFWDYDGSATSTSPAGSSTPTSATSTPP